MLARSCRKQRHVCEMPCVTHLAAADTHLIAESYLIGKQVEALALCQEDLQVLLKAQMARAKNVSWFFTTQQASGLASNKRVRARTALPVPP